MICPHCQSPELRNLNRRTELGYAVFRCGGCRRKSNERTGTPFNYLELPTDIVFEIALDIMDPHVVVGDDNEVQTGTYGVFRDLFMPLFPVRVGGVDVHIASVFVHP